MAPTMAVELLQLHADVERRAEHLSAMARGAWGPAGRPVR